MLISYARVSKAAGSQPLDPQRDALCEVGVSATSSYPNSCPAKSDPVRPRLR